MCRADSVLQLQCDRTNVQPKREWERVPRKTRMYERCWTTDSECAHNFLPITYLFTVYITTTYSLTMCAKPRVSALNLLSFSFFPILLVFSPYKMPKPRADSKCVCVSLCMFEWVGKRVSACIPWYWAFGIAEVYGELLLWVLRKLPNHMNSNRIIVITQQRWNEMKSTYYNAVDYEDSSKCYYSQRIDWNRREIMFAVNGEKTHTQRKMCELRMRHALAG